ncbi:MAG: GFA family protein [Steroidobacteraceae bacterium]
MSEGGAGLGGPHSGSCLCGGVRFKLQGAFESFFLCHCAYCRKDTGSAHAANLFSSTAKVEWVCGRDLVRDYSLPGTRHARSFCSVCGSALPHVMEAMVVVPAGCLDTDPAVKPDAHIFAASRAPWDHGLAELRSFDAFPASV